MVVIAQLEHHFVILLFKLHCWLEGWVLLLSYLTLSLLPSADDLNLGIFLIRIDIKSANFDVISSQFLILIQFNSLLALKILNFHGLLSDCFTCSTLGTVATSGSCGLVGVRWGRGCKVRLVLRLDRFLVLTDRIRLCQ